MSHIPLRDNPDCAGLPDDVYDRLAPLGDLIDQSHGRSYHQSECGRCCTDPECRILRDALLGASPSTEDVLGFLVAKGLLDLGAAERFATEGANIPATEPDRAHAVSVPDEAVTAAARAAYEREAQRNGLSDSWDDLGFEQRTFLEDARAGLTAALPLMQAARDTEIAELREQLAQAHARAERRIRDRDEALALVADQGKRYREEIADLRPREGDIVRLWPENDTAVTGRTEIEQPKEDR